MIKNRRAKLIGKFFQILNLKSKKLFFLIFFDLIFFFLLMVVRMVARFVVRLVINEVFWVNDMDGCCHDVCLGSHTPKTFPLFFLGIRWNEQIWISIGEFGQKLAGLGMFG